MNSDLRDIVIMTVIIASTVAIVTLIIWAAP